MQNIPALTVKDAGYAAEEKSKIKYMKKYYFSKEVLFYSARFDCMINISNEREKQQQTAVFSFGKRRKRYEEKSFERIIVRSNDTWGSSRMVEAPRIQEAQIQHLRQRQRERKQTLLRTK